MEWKDDSEFKTMFEKEFRHAWYGSEIKVGRDYVKIPTRKYCEWLENLLIEYRTLGKETENGKQKL